MNPKTDAEARNGKPEAVCTASGAENTGLRPQAVRLSEPVLIWPQSVATAMSAMVASDPLRANPGLLRVLRAEEVFGRRPRTAFL